MTHSLKDLNRRNLDFNISDVKSVLPEYFQGEYGTDSGSLIKLLETYYDFLDSSGKNSFKTEIGNVISARDISQTDTDYLDELIKEIGNGLQSSSFFENPRLMARLLPEFYSTKGSTNATEGFFRGFFGEEVTIEHPKDQLLFVGGKDSSGIQGQIGFDFNHRIKDNGQFQIFSILIKSGLSTSDYSTLYQKFAHPAGFNFAGQLVTDGQGILSLTGTGEDPLEEDDDLVLATGLGDGALTLLGSFSQMTAIFDSVGDNGDPNIAGVFRASLSDVISKYQTVTVGNLRNAYGTIDNLFNANSFTFDDSDRADSAGNASIDMSFTTETMDNDMFTRYLSDSAI